MKQKSNYIIDHIKSIKNKKYEIAIITPLLCDEELLIIQPYTQFPVTTTKGERKYIDLYYEEIQLAIEILEPFHNNQIEEDKIRKSDIEGKLECDFEEIIIDKDFVLIEEISKIKKLILNKIEEKRKIGQFTDWEIPFHTKQQITIDYPKSISVNANNFIEGAHGPLRLKEEYRENADLLIVYSGDTITKVYKINPKSWTEYHDNTKGYIHNGIEDPNHPLLASGMTNWEITTNKFVGEYLKNLKKKKNKFIPNKSKTPLSKGYNKTKLNRTKNK